MPPMEGHGFCTVTNYLVALNMNPTLLRVRSGMGLPTLDQSPRIIAPDCNLALRSIIM
jgi:hypothetical protein